MLKVEIDLAAHKILHRFSYNGSNRYWPVIIHVRFGTAFVNRNDFGHFPDIRKYSSYQ